jgi:type II secretory pathway component PulF
MIVTPGKLSGRAEFYRQLGAMIEAGVPLMQALQMGSNTTSLRASRKAVAQILEHLKNGLTFSESMEKVHGWMPDFDRALLSAGERSGRLDYTFKILGTHYADRADVARETITNLLLPAANLHVLILIFPLPYLIAMVLGFFSNDYAACIPYLLDKLFWFTILYSTILVLILLAQGKWGKRGKFILETIWLMIPVLRTAVKYMTLARLSATLEALISSGVPVIQSWPMAAAASGSPRVIMASESWESELAHGATPADLLNHVHYFPDMFKNLYHTGEESGRLDDSLKRMHTYYHDEGLRALRFFCKVLSFTIYILIAAVVAYNVIKFYLTYYGGLMNSIQ